MNKNDQNDPPTPAEEEATEEATEETVVTRTRLSWVVDRYPAEELANGQPLRPGTPQDIFVFWLPGADDVSVAAPSVERFCAWLLEVVNATLPPGTSVRAAHDTPSALLQWPMNARKVD